jgi:hypothetical protein
MESWSQVVAQGNQILMYQFGTGLGASAILWGDGTYQFQRYLPGLGGEWYHVERMSYGQFFYNQLTGQGVTTHLAPDGSLRTLKSPVWWIPGAWLIACQREGT